MFCLSGEPGGYWSKGHHLPEVFCLAVCRFQEEVLEVSPLDEDFPLPKDVVHKYWREELEDSETEVTFIDCEPSAEGAYPVTIISLEDMVPQSELKLWR